MSGEIEKFKQIYYPGRFIRHNGNRKVILKASMDNYGGVLVVFVDRTKCSDLKEIELDGRK